MSAETDIFSTLSTAPAITALVGQKIFPNAAAEEAVPPLIVFQRSSSDPTYTIDGTLVANDITMSVFCWALSRSLAEQIGDAVQTVMAPAGFYESTRDGAAWDEDTQLYAAVIDFRMWET